jgi:hypothetical protein
VFINYQKKQKHTFIGTVVDSFVFISLPKSSGLSGTTFVEVSSMAETGGDKISLECDDDEECSFVVGDLDQVTISNRVRLGPKRIGKGEVLRGNEGIRERLRRVGIRVRIPAGKVE